MCMSTLDSGRVHARWIVTVACLALSAGYASTYAQQTFGTASGEVVVETKAVGLEQPWSLAFLSGGRILVSERPGRLRIVSPEGVLSPPVEGVPAVHAIADRSPGLLDVALDRGYAHNQTIYFCYVEPVDGGGRTAVARARLVDGQRPRLDQLRTIFRAKGPAGVEVSFGCRLVQASDGNLFVTVGEFDHWPEAQNLRSHLGKVVRIDPDGFAPSDNPFRNRPDALPEIWSYGHRNPQGLAIHPGTGKLWSHEHGRRGGDEINIVEPGKNYGWPVIGYGTGYDGTKIHSGTHREGMEQPVKHWEPSIAPSGMAFYTGKLFPLWRNNLFIGALAGRMLVRLELDDEGGVVSEERLLRELNERIRDVRQGPDGALWLLTGNDAGRLLRVSPISSFQTKGSPR
ncbi:MAG: PQQ-dependent sugar dehydrogenase [Hyphomicrobiaceae bacterium]